MKRKNVRFTILAAAVGACGLMLGGGQAAHASILGTDSLGAGPIDTIYSDNFTSPVTNVNSAGSDPTAIAGNVVAGGDGGSGGTPGATYIGIATPAGSGATDAVWNYSGSTSATITSPAGNVSAGEDANTIVNLTLPLVPIVGDVYDLELTMVAASATGAHGLEMGYLFGNGNGHNTSPQALSNNFPIGLILDRDAVSSGGYFDVFEGSNTNGDTHFAPNGSSLTGGSPGSTVTVDEIYTPTSSTAGTESVYINGTLATGSPFALSGLSGGITDVSFGDNRVASGTFTNFSVTAEAVPEPASTGILLLGAGLAMKRRRRD
jgi:hypothetical protein